MYSSGGDPVQEPTYASIDDVDYKSPAPVPMPPSSATKMTAFLNTLGLLEKCKDLADEAGIDEPGDFKMFTEDELVSQHMFKVGHVRKIFAALA